MPSPVHQSLLLWLVRKMTADGFFVACCDGPLPQGGTWNTLPRSTTALGVRPDACAIASETGAFAFAEAKTHRDIVNPHTRTQLRTLGQLVTLGGPDCRLYIAVPRSAAPMLDQVVHDTGLCGARQLIRLHVPDCLLEDYHHECA